MIREISISNFKVFKDCTTFSNLKPITILTGINGRGKSTTLQTLLLLRQSIMANEWTKEIYLNGCYANLGSVKDVRNENSEPNEPINFKIVTDQNLITYFLQPRRDKDQSLSIGALSINDRPIRLNRTIHNLLPDGFGIQHSDFAYIMSRMQYIGAERLGPQLSYESSNDDINIGSKGEYAAKLLNSHGQDDVSDQWIQDSLRMFPKVTEESIEVRNVQGLLNFWLSQMFGTTVLKSIFVEDANVYTLHLNILNRLNESKPTNMGFGYSYSYPLLLAGLIAKKGDVVIFENPEAHLHAKAQSVLGQFIGVFASQGVQVFVETHSEHIINGIRIALLSGLSIGPDAAKIIYFCQRHDDDGVIYKSIDIEPNGDMTDFPADFLDQQRYDLLRIIQLGNTR